MTSSPLKPSFTLQAPGDGTAYWIYVEEPGAVPGTGLWPVVLFMDGDDQFAAGVGYGAGYSKPQNRRGRDYTPDAHGDEPASGGADEFLKFLTATLLPELARRYPMDGDKRGIAGHSLGSLLVLHALFQEKPFFTHHLASAPSLWWADRAMLGRVTKLRERQAALPAKLYLSVGGKDSASMTGDLTLLEKQLTEKPFAGLDFVTRRFDKKNHFNVLPAAFGAGLAALFGPGKK